MRLAEAAGQDVRQIINIMQMARSNPKVLQSNFDDDKAKDSKNMLGPFDAIWPLFNKESVLKQDLNARSDFFFVDYSMVPMIVQENYLSYTPAQAEGLPPKQAQLATLEAASAAADAIALGDTISPLLRG